MKSIQQLIQYLLSKGDSDSKRLFDALKQGDDNTIELTNRINALESRNMKYFCRAQSHVIQSIPNGVATTLNFGTTLYPQFGNMHDNIINNDKIYIRRNGVYFISGELYFEPFLAASPAVIYVVLTRNGVVSQIATNQNYIPINTFWALPITTQWYCYKDDYLQLQAYQNTGGPVNIISNVPPDYVTVQFTVTERMEDLNPSEYGLLNPEANMR